MVNYTKIFVKRINSIYEINIYLNKGIFYKIRFKINILL